MLTTLQPNPTQTPSITPETPSLDWPAVRQAWKTAARARTASVTAHAAYALLRGQDLTKAFTPIRRPEKITSNGNDPYFALNRALRQLAHPRPEALRPWSDLLSTAPLDARGRYQGNHPLLQALRAALAKTPNL